MCFPFARLSILRYSLFLSQAHCKLAFQITGALDEPKILLLCICILTCSQAARYKMKLLCISLRKFERVEVAVTGAVAGQIFDGAIESVEHVAGLHRHTYRHFVLGLHASFFELELISLERNLIHIIVAGECEIKRSDSLICNRVASAQKVGKPFQSVSILGTQQQGIEIAVLAFSAQEIFCSTFQSIPQFISVPLKSGPVKY